MARHWISYEVAFADYLRRRSIPFVPVDESRRSVFAGERIKSFDLILHAPGERRWIVDVKGRQFPYVAEDGGRRYWENWVTREDIDGLREWETVFGDGFEGCFVFAYLLDGPPERWPVAQPHVFRDGRYAFLSVSLAQYAEHCRPRSVSWDTVTVPTGTFRQIARPVAAGCPGQTDVRITAQSA
jgi:hypothetical protein